MSSSELRQILVTIIATIGIFSLGNVLAYTSPAIPSMENYKVFQNNNGSISMSTSEKSWIGSISMLGALISSPFSGLCVDKYGRKNSMLLFSPIFSLGWILIGATNKLYLILIGRFITGFCGGAFSLAAPVYISEISDPKIRGALSSIFQLMMVLGILFTYIIGSYLSWANLAFISSVFPALAFILIPFIQKTPRYLLKVNQEEEAQKSLKWLRKTLSQTEIKKEITEIQNSLKESRESAPSFTQFFQSSYYIRPILISLSLMIFEQISGFNAIIFYSGSIFKEAGTFLSSDSSSILIGVVQVISTIVSLVIVDRIGRRILLLFSQLSMGISLFLLSAFFYIKEKNGDINIVNLTWLPIVTLIIFIIGFSLGIGPLSWTIMGEILPPNVKGVCSSLGTFLVWLFAFIVTQTFNGLAHELGIYSCFAIFSLCCFIGLFSIYLTVPETNGKTLDQIQDLFKSNY